MSDSNDMRVPADEKPDTTYNGWTNYETWAVKLWLDNEEGSYTETREMARQEIVYAEDQQEPGAPFTVQENARANFARRLQELHEEANPLEDGDASVFTDLLRAALSEVNWYEIAENILSEISEESSV